ncbi:sugar phosphate nucleotidyltransferase [Flavobacteriaceae bacterium]|nr:sugar phosphate nucleotidyltransferase [Flavobacteriaceae bacterium]MDA9572933.1 sugar phosphate nucleotidyltransferase [Flavobacteriaceae bacterium]MDB4196270.1 sugar phosphate nucleotidyltransferase [Flavobacteriaceae bacterium]MDC1320442.1 sugar phosphate nucleotidyltransferase [Flavobacteriaceae bacterium]
MTLLLMAAGSGSRYGKLKQFDELGPKAEFLLEFSIYDAINNGFNHIVLVTKKENKDFLNNYLINKIPNNIKVDVVVQDINDLPKDTKLKHKRIKPWGTAHAVWSARNVIKSSFVIINADDYYGKEAFEQAANYMKSVNYDKSYGLVTYKLGKTLSDFGTVSRGICQVENNKLISIKEHIKIYENKTRIIDEDSGNILEHNDDVSMNFWICNTDIFDYIENYFKKFLQQESNLEKNEIYLPFVAQEMMNEGLISINAIKSDSDWFGVTYFEDKDNAVKSLQSYTSSNKYPSPLWN